MAAYAALVSLMNTVEQIQNHPCSPITLRKEEARSLIEKVAFLQEFLEANNFQDGNDEIERLLSRIADASHAAEDIIESRVADQVLAGSASSDDGESVSSVQMYRALQKVIEDMDSIRKEVTEIKHNMGTRDQPRTCFMKSVVLLETPSTEQVTVVGFDDVLHELVDQLTGHQSCRQIIPITGMGGIGKTTLAKSVYINPLIEQYFDVRAWVTISHEYDIRQILLDVLLCQRNQERKESLSQLSQEKLGEKVYKSLCGRRYLIVMDDMWNVNAWDEIKLFFPDKNDGSRIIVTTRISELVFHLAGPYSLKMNLLDDDKSWELLCKNVFGREDCPPELEEIGKQIAKNCRGLPLSIVVIGGLLAKSKQARAHWEYIAENLNSIMNLEENERCFKTLHLSYHELPIHLKPCFLYMGTFPEDRRICVSQLIKQWIGEGFLKPTMNKNLEEAAEEYLMDLIDRNLILVSQCGSFGRIKYCSIHDLLRDLCLKQARKEKFLCVLSKQVLEIPHCRRMALHQSISEEESRRCLSSASVTRSLICYFQRDLPLFRLRLLRVLKTVDEDRSLECRIHYNLEAMFQLVNLRYLAVVVSDARPVSLASVSLWNLQILIIQGCWNHGVAPSEIWRMPQLRHVKSRPALYLPHPPQCGLTGDVILESLQTLSGIRSLRLDEEVVKRIPNVKRLRVSFCYSETKCEVASDHCLYNLGRLCKLESINFFFDPNKQPSRGDLLQNLVFPNSLKKLTLAGTYLRWEEDISRMIGSLPNLEVLKLKQWSFVGPRWEAVEGQFLSLKFLGIYHCHDLEDWTAESSHFPRLEQLVLVYTIMLKEIPLEIGEIPTLQSVRMADCTDSAIISAKTMLEEQEELGNEGLQVRVQLSQKNDQALTSLESRNFHVETW